MSGNRFVPLESWREYPVDEMRRRVTGFLEDMRRRRTVREFSPRPVPRDIIEAALAAAGTAPSGANLQPWHFVVVSDAGTRRRIRVAAEAEEKEFYEHRASKEWLEALEPLGTDFEKAHITDAPWVVVASFVNPHDIVFSGLWQRFPLFQKLVESGDLPDIAVIPQPGLVRDLAANITPVPQATLDAHAGQPQLADRFLQSIKR